MQSSRHGVFSRDTPRGPRSGRRIHRAFTVDECSLSNHREWVIRDVGAATGLTNRALRHCEQTGLLSPPRVGPSGYRYYDVRELAKIYSMLSLRALDLS